MIKKHESDIIFDFSTSFWLYLAILSLIAAMSGFCYHTRLYKKTESVFATRFEKQKPDSSQFVSTP